MGWEARARKAGVIESGAIRMLRRRVAVIRTRAEFEDMVLTSDYPERFRTLVEPMLRPGIPCCGRNPWEPHQKRCPMTLAAADRGPRPVILDPAGRVANA